MSIEEQKRLWKAHIGTKKISGCPWENQCAARMSLAFQKIGVDLTVYRGYKMKLRNGKILAARAQELSDWMSQNFRFGMAEIIRSNRIPSEFQHDAKDIYGTPGIIFIKNGWGAMDHIDLWDGRHLKLGTRDYLDRGSELLFWGATFHEI